MLKLMFISFVLCSLGWLFFICFWVLLVCQVLIRDMIVEKSYGGEDISSVGIYEQLSVWVRVGCIDSVSEEWIKYLIFGIYEESVKGEIENKKKGCKDYELNFLIFESYNQIIEDVVFLRVCVCFVYVFNYVKLCNMKFIFSKIL